MNRIIYGNINEWTPVKNGTQLIFETNRPRNIKFKATTNGLSEIWISTNKSMKDQKLIGLFANNTVIEFSTLETAYVIIKSESSANTFVNIRDINQETLKDDHPSYTNIEPRVKPQHNEVQQILRYVQINEQRREKQMADERKALRAELAKLAQPVITSEEPATMPDIPPLREESLLKAVTDEKATE